MPEDGHSPNWQAGVARNAEGYGLEASSTGRRFLTQTALSRMIPTIGLFHPNTEFWDDVPVVELSIVKNI